ncbi:MAG: leucine-rich repeat protein [Spirochaetaceae bacterium]|jgi:hypothetical protein|nr:leucine-rich repeat protein [Spirochaetaceae bacterium]
MENKITKFAIGSVVLIVLAFAGVFASCNAIADTSGLNLTPETVWISLTPTKAALEGGTLTATLTLDFSKEIKELVETLGEEGLAKLFTFEYHSSTESGITATGVKKMVAGIYTLKVKKVPDDAEGIVLVTIKKTGIAPATRIWALNGDVVRDADVTASLLDFRFEAGKNAALSKDAVGGIDHGAGTVVVVLPFGVPTSPLIPTLKTNPGNTFIPETQTNFSGDVLYTISTAKSITVQNQKTYTVSVMQQTQESASILSFGFTKEENSAAGLAASVSGSIDDEASPKTITVTVSAETDLSKLKPIIIHSGAGISPANLASRDFSNSLTTPVAYTVTAANGTTTVEYWVMVQKEGYVPPPLPPPEEIYDYTAHSNSWNDLSQFIIDNQGSSNGVANPARIKIINAGELDAVAMTAVNGKVSDAAQYVSLNFGEGNSFANNEVTSPVMDDIIKDNSYIKGIALPEGVTGFNGYDELVVGTPSYYVYHYAFTNCQYLTSITLPSSVSTIGMHTFENCTGLTSITLPASVSTIGMYAFANCTSLANITFPASLTWIYDAAFGGCTSLTSIDMSVCTGTVTLCDRVFYGNPWNGQTSGLVSATLGAIDFSYYYGQFPGDDGEGGDDMIDIYDGPGTYTRDPAGTLWSKQPL